MKKKTEEILLNLSRKFYKKKYLKIEQNKKSLIGSLNKNNKTKDFNHENNEENFNNLNVPLKRIFFKEKETDDIHIENVSKYDNSIKITNGAYNNEIPKIKYNKVSKTINNQKSNRKYFVNNFKNRTKNNIENDRDINQNYKSMKVFEQNNKNILEDKFEEPNEIDNSLLDKYCTINNNDENQPKFYFNGKEIYKMEDTLKHSKNNSSSSLLNPSLSSKLYFDYKRISNLLTNKNLEDNKYINKTNYNSFRKKKSEKEINNTKVKNNLYTPLNNEKFEKKLLHKNFSFNINKKFLNNDEKNNDIQINNFRQNKLKTNCSSVSLNNNANVIERNYNLYFSPTTSNNNNNFDYYNTSSKASFKTTVNKNNSISNQHSSSNLSNNLKIKNSNKLKTNNKRNRNIKYIQQSYFDSNIKNEKYASSIDVLKRNENIELNNCNIKNRILFNKKDKNICEKRKIFKKKNNSFNHFNLENRNNQLKIKKMKNSNDLSDDIFNYRNNNSDIKFIEKLKENKKQIIYDYYANYTQKENQNSIKTFCFNNFNNNLYDEEKNNNNKKDIKKQYIQNFENEKNSIIDDKEINDIINKYKNNSISNSRQTKNQKIKNMIFTYERMFKNKTISSLNNTNKNNFFMNTDNKNDINYKRSQKGKIKYLTPNTTKNKGSNNLILDKDGQKKAINEYNLKENEKNLKFDFNITQSKSILDNIDFENNSLSGNFQKIKTFIRNSFPTKNEKIKKFNQKNQKIPNNEKRIKPLKAKKQINQNKNRNNNSFENSENINSIEQINNNGEINLDYSDASPSSSNSNLNANINQNINEECIREIKKPIIIDSQSHIYDNYGYSKNHNSKKRNILKNNESIFNNKSFKKNDKKKNNIFNNIKNDKTEKIKCNCEKENIEKNEDQRTIDSDNLLLITNITKCPKCHCLFGKSSKLLKNKDNNKK